MKLGRVIPWIQEVSSPKAQPRRVLGHQLRNHLGAFHASEALIQSEESVGEALVINAHLL